MAEFQVRHGSIRNPGNGSFRLFGDRMARGISCITIVEGVPGRPISGALNFSLGIVGETLDLAAGERVLTFPGGGPVAYVDFVATGLNPADNFSIVLT